MISKTILSTESGRNNSNKIESFAKVILKLAVLTGVALSGFILATPLAFAYGTCGDNTAGLPVYYAQATIQGDATTHLNIFGTTSPQNGVFCRITTATSGVSQNSGSFTFNPVSASLYTDGNGAGNFQIILSTSPFAGGTNIGVVYYRVYQDGNVDGSIFTSTTTSALAFQSATTTLNATQGSCAQAGNIFAEGICTAFAYLFEPDPATLAQFGSLSSTTQTKFPFSYVASVANVWSALSASTTANFPAYSYNLYDLGIGSTSALGNILPNTQVFSSSTVEHYDTVGAIPALKTLAGVVIVLTLIADIFFTSRNLMH